MSSPIQYTRYKQAYEINIKYYFSAQVLNKIINPQTEFRSYLTNYFKIHNLIWFQNSGFFKKQWLQQNGSKG